MGLHCLQPRSDSRTLTQSLGRMCAGRGGGPLAHDYHWASVYRTKRNLWGWVERGVPQPRTTWFVQPRNMTFPHLQVLPISPFYHPSARWATVTSDLSCGNQPLPDHSPPALLLSGTFSTHICTGLPTSDSPVEPFHPECGDKALCDLVLLLSSVIPHHTKFLRFPCSSLGL
uniref:Uncharacterized protein n=1 Tax=Myotis myotis TaxID=51298 RepID=A0A7J7VYC7_MYOMY|nr:hypothetical protein mMyoMyo1_012228 [Myotis myotis]